MARISLVEQYQNKDVITQIYGLKDTVEGFDEKIDSASQAAASATSNADQAKALAQEAITQSGTYDAKITAAVATAEDAESKASAAKTVADASLYDAQIKTGSADGNLYMKQNDGGEKATAIPIANSEQAGLMNAQTFKSISSIDARVSALEGKQSIVYVTFASDSPSQTEITAVFTSVSGRAPVKGDIADDIARALIYQYDGTQWIKTQSVASVWTNTTSGLVLGTPSTGAAGTIFAETDGTGSVNGWDPLVTRVTNAESNIANNTANITVNAESIKTAKTDIAKNTTDIATLNTTVTSGLAAKQATLKTASVVLTASGWSSLSQTVSCAVVTASNIVWVAPADNMDAYGEAGVYCSAQGAGTLTFKCTSTPSVAFTVSIVTADI